ncbi:MULTISPECIES: sulfite exporter TauE/SafE family protein [unclassified Afifella]|uniref:sulfite exporter TauE/SafE family protein n=1 Tax=unclassified Afifella TaxID=2624128 RepID=UPI001F16DA84|nr:sulfite exporter TauE/SafE family protein [Afifella sp. JA880]MCF1504770.1 sulfite exporter TauE/SafE family protein [Afifella sp. H1R]MCT8269062.1 sulfite exporter TauE/SafE family protein [Afifella sp. JA880]
MQLYLPIAELTVNIFVYLGMGAAVGFISGMFGVGGGFLLTPLLIFSGISPAVAVATVTPQIVASSTSAAISYWRRRMIDPQMTMFLIVGGVTGSWLGVRVFTMLRSLGQLDVIISLSYVTFLGLIGGLMLREALRSFLRARRGRPPNLRRGRHHNWLLGLPFKVRFRRSKLYVSVIPVILLGLSIGFLGTVLGIGGGFIMVPALIYLLRVPSNVVIGTSLGYILFTMALATVLHSLENGAVDLMLACLLIVGGVVGAQFGAQIGQAMRGDQLRLFLALLVLAVALRFLLNLFLPPASLYSIALLQGIG